MTGTILRALISLLLVAILVARSLHWIDLPSIDLLENHVYDVRLELSLPGGVDQRIVIVDIDDQSLAAEGQWPWPRQRIAELVSRLFDQYQIGALVFDIVFPEQQRTDGLDTMKALAKSGGQWQWLSEHIGELEQVLDQDAMLAGSLVGRPMVGAYYFSPDARLRRGTLPEPLFYLGEQAADLAFERQGYVGGVGVISDAMLARGFVDNPLVDEDGVYRRAAVLQAHDGGLYESLALTMTRLALGDPPAGLQVSEDGQVIEALTLGDVRIPLDENAGVLVPYRGGQGSFRYVSVAQVLDGSADPEVLAGAVVLVGSTAPGLSDLRSTPLQNVFPGVEVQANLIAGMLDGALPEVPDRDALRSMESLALLLLGLLLTVLLPRLSVAVAAAACGSVGLILVVVNFLAWKEGLALPLAAALLLILLLFAWHTAFGFFSETRRRHDLARVFGRYVPGDLVSEMSNSPEDFALGGESRDMTVLFTDVRNFTTLSEGMSPGELTQMMNAYLTEMTRIIHKYRGTVDKYIGDAVMAFWGAPLRQADHAQLGLRAAVEMIAATEALSEQFSQRGWPALRIGGGINSGVMNVGNMGSEFRVAYTVMGDAVNLAARLEGLTKFYQSSLVVGEGMLEKVPGMVFRELDRVRVKGRGLSVSIYEFVGERDQVTAAMLSELEAYRWALGYYRSRNWEAAESAFEALCRHAPQTRLYAFYLERVVELRANPPPVDWDGVFVHKQK